MKSKKNWSLELRQWVGLVIMTLCGFILVSTVIYGFTANHLQQRRQESLANMTQIVDRLLQEDRHASRSYLFDRLNDHFLGHSDLTLILLDSQGKVVYQNAHLLPANKLVSLEFSTSSDVPTFGKLSGLLSQDIRPDEQLLRHLLWTLSAASLFGALLFAFGGLLLIRQGLRPVKHLMEQIDTLEISRLDQRLDGTRQPAELQPLVKQFNELLQRIELAYRQLDGFNSNVAHELNTPLSTLITSTEIALRKSRDLHAMRDLLGSQLEELQRMSGMVRDMLFLAQVDRGARARRTDVPSMRAIAESVAEYFEAALTEAGIDVVVNGDAAGKFDVPLLKRAISNLLDNACRYATRGSTVRMSIATTDQGVRFGVANSGNDIPAEHLPHIFDRLYRVDAARAQEQSQHGLGLSIVAAVARMHSGTTFGYSHDGCTEIGMVLQAED